MSKNKPKYRNAELRGKQARKEGKGRNENPYGWDAPLMAAAWDQGWLEAGRATFGYVKDDGLDLDDPDFAEYLAY